MLRRNWPRAVVVLACLFLARFALAANERPAIELDGNERYDRAGLEAVLALETEPDRSPAHLARKLLDFYVERGFLDAEVVAETRALAGAAPGHGSLLLFHITEHPRVTVARRLYPCLKVEAIANLSGGGPRSPEAIGREIDSYLESELPGENLVQVPDSRALDATISASPAGRSGTRPAPPNLDPDATFVPDVYERALAHVQELYRHEGYLHAQVGPLLVLRRACSAASPRGVCKPVPPASPLPEACTYNAAGLPISESAPSEGSDLTCIPDAKAGIECEGSLSLRIPIRLGPRTFLYDLGFTGTTAFVEQRLAQETGLVLGAPLRYLALEEARKRILALYKEDGYFFADARQTLDFSGDSTRAAVRFDVHEGPRVLVDRIVVRGNRRTSEGLIRRRIALATGQPYRTSDIRKTEQQLARLNVFSSLHVTLADPLVPEERKTVLVTLVERKRIAHEVVGGISSGDGFHGEYAFSHGNLAREAVAFTARVRASYLPDFLIFDPVVRANFDTLCVACADFTRERIAAMVTTAVNFPELGIGPLVSGVLEGTAAHTLEHDFVLTKVAAVPTVHYRPVRGLDVALSFIGEFNDTDIFGFGTIAAYLENQATSTELAALLRFPDGPSLAFAERVAVSWDHRDSSFNPHEGFFLAGSLENMDWTGQTQGQTPDPYGPMGPTAAPYGHTLRLSQTAAVYRPLGNAVTLAAEIRMGLNVQLDARSATYPDRLFFLGGPDSLRGYWQDSLVPQEDANRIAANSSYTIKDVALRGGNVMLNGRLELRFPVLPPFGSALFLETGNLWAPPDAEVAATNDALKDLFSEFSLRTTGGLGLRIDTPVGPAAIDLGLNLSLLAASSTDPRRGYENPYAFSFAIGQF